MRALELIKIFRGQLHHITLKALRLTRLVAIAQKLLSSENVGEVSFQFFCFFSKNQFGFYFGKFDHFGWDRGVLAFFLIPFLYLFNFFTKTRGILAFFKAILRPFWRWSSWRNFCNRQHFRSIRWLSLDKTFKTFFKLPFQISSFPIEFLLINEHVICPAYPGVQLNPRRLRDPTISIFIEIAV